MKKCLICGRRVVSKRKDAIYCRNPRCRKKAFLARKEQAASAPLPIGTNKASVVVSFPDGSRWLMELTPLQTMEPAQLPTLVQVSSPVDPMSVNASPGPASDVKSHVTTRMNGSEQIVALVTDEAGDVETSERIAAASVAKEARILGENGSENVPSVVADEANSSSLVTDSKVEAAESSPLASGSVGCAEPAAVETPADASPEPREPALRTVELYFVDTSGGRLAFDLAVRYEGGRGRVTNGAHVRLGLVPSEGVGLGGSPGRWREFYGLTLPSRHGFPSDLAILCFDDYLRRVYAPDAELLKVVFGSNWQEQIRRLVDARTGDGPERFR